MDIEALLNKHYGNWVHANGASWTAHMRNALTELAQGYEQRIRELEDEALLDDELRERMSGILTKTVNVLKGEPEKLCLHSWHDLPEVAQERIRQLEEEVHAHAENAEDFARQLEEERVPEGLALVPVETLQLIHCDVENAVDWLSSAASALRNLQTYPKPKKEGE